VATLEALGSALVLEAVRPVAVASLEAVRPVAVASLEALGSALVLEAVRPVAVATLEAVRPVAGAYFAASAVAECSLLGLLPQLEAAALQALLYLGQTPAA
tara:strand:- start:2637 stop:2939 length:303 start_codon:yes stop_codon:yes gene_type:complete